MGQHCDVVTALAQAARSAPEPADSLVGTSLVEDLRAGGARHGQHDVARARRDADVDFAEPVAERVDERRGKDHIAEEGRLDHQDAADPRHLFRPPAAAPRR
jgi:hypothetical protein